MTNNNKLSIIKIKEFLTTYRWFSLAILGIVSALIEFMEVISQGQILSAPEPMFEVILHGIVLPLLLIVLQKTETKKNDVINAFTLINSFVYQLNSAKTWNELTETIVQFPRNIVPLSGISLWIYNPDTQKLNLEIVHSFEPTPGKSNEVITSLESGTVKCFHEEIEKSSSGLMACTCSLQVNENEVDYQRYCLPLPNAKLSIGLIHIYLPKAYKLLDDQKYLLDRIVPEVVLAINKFLLQRANLLQKEAIQSERRRMASDLHDTLGQDLAYLRSRIEQLADDKLVNEVPAIKRELQKMSVIAADANKTIRNIISTARATSKNPLDVRLLEYATSIGDRAGFKVTLHSEGTLPDLPSQMQFQIFLIFREIIANIERHASAKNVNIELLFADELTIAISDNGRGFHLTNIDQTEHFGLSIIESRTKELSGDFSITSNPGEGTQISIRLPIPEQTVRIQ